MASVCKILALGQTDAEEAALLWVSDSGIETDETGRLPNTSHAFTPARRTEPEESTTNDLIVVGTVSRLEAWNMQTLRIKATGRGSYQRTQLDSHGFPRGYLTRSKTVYGFRTGDLVIAIVPSGKKAGTHTGRVAVRASGSFDIQTGSGTIQGINWKRCRRAMPDDGYTYTQQPEILSSS